MRQIWFLSNVVERDHRAVKRITRPVLGFKSLRSARMVIAGNEAMRMINKGQLDCPEGQLTSPADQVHSPAFRPAADGLFQLILTSTLQQDRRGSSPGSRPRGRPTDTTSAAEIRAARRKSDPDVARRRFPPSTSIDYNRARWINGLAIGQISKGAESRG